MIGLPAVLLGAMAVLRFGLYWRQRRRLLSQRQHSTLQVACDAALRRARRLLRIELARLFITMVLLMLVSACAYEGRSGAAMAVTVALLSYVAESIVAAAAGSTGLRGKAGSMAIGAVPAAFTAMLSASLIGRMPWMAWLIATSLAGIVGVGSYQLCEWLFIRPQRERRSPLSDGPLCSRLEALARSCEVADAHFCMVDNDPHTANARAESDPRGRRVVLWPALVQRLEADELDAVVVHELGHLASRHLLSRFVTMALLLSIATVMASLVAASVWAPSGRQAYLHIATVAALLPLILAALRYGLLALYRQQEIEADGFVSNGGRGSALANALLKLSPSMTADPQSDVWHRCAYDSHPPIGMRLRQLRVDS